MPQTTVTWRLAPEGLIEEPYTVALDTGEQLDVGASEIKVVGPYSPGGVRASDLLRWRNLVEAHAGAAGLVRGLTWALEGPAMAHDAPDGSRTVALMVGVEAKLEQGTPDLIMTDASSGIVTFDSRGARITRQRDLAEVVERAQAVDPLSSLLLDTLRRAAQGDGYQLLHLYEIGDALARRFGGEKKARKKLGITKADWSFLGRLANNEAVDGSRHRGQHLADGRKLPHATEEQMDRAQSIALAMFEAYCRWVAA